MTNNQQDDENAHDHTIVYGTSMKVHPDSLKQLRVYSAINRIPISHVIGRLVEQTFIPSTSDDDLNDSALNE